MVKICFLLLAHKDAELIINQIRYLTHFGDYVVLHIDGNAPKSLHDVVSKSVEQNPNVHIVASVRAGWGGWSLVKAAMRMINAGFDAFPDATHFYHLSGQCMPIRSRHDLAEYLEKSNKDLIETVEFYKGGWIKTGPHRERVEFYHFINERKYKRLFYLNYKAHRLLGIRRTRPDGVQLAIGSQWWCLRRTTLQRIRLYLLANPRVAPFFKWSWIPDEIFFQSLVNSIIDKRERESRPPTFLYFSDYGIPTVFANDHYDFLIQQDSFFARKISEHATDLHMRLIRRFISSPTGGNKTRAGKQTMEFTIYAGRKERRFAAPIWSNNDDLAPEKTLYVIAAKKWHIGERLSKALGQATGIPQLGYAFENSCHQIPPLGGIEKDTKIRHQAPVTFINVAMHHYQSNALIMCIDPSHTAVLNTLLSTHAKIRLLEIEHLFNDQYFLGHAERLGIMVLRNNDAARREIFQTFRQAFIEETRALQRLSFERYQQVKCKHGQKARAAIFGEFFNQPRQKFTDAAAIATED